MYLLGNHRPIEISSIAAFDDHHSGILPQPPCQLSIAHIHRVHLGRAALEKTIRKSSGGRTDIHRGHAARIDYELLERGGKFQTSTAHEWMVRPANARSEEHTSELQSRRDLVCRLLLE